MKTINIITLIIISLLFLLSCNKDKGPYLSSSTNFNEKDTVSYSQHIQPLLDANCISCHNASHSKLDLQSAVSYNQLLTDGFSAPYVDTANPSQSNLYLHLTGALSLMPPAGALSLNDQELFLLWIEQGAENN